SLPVLAKKLILSHWKIACRLPTAPITWNLSVALFVELNRYRSSHSGAMAASVGFEASVAFEKLELAFPKVMSPLLLGNTVVKLLRKKLKVTGRLTVVDESSTFCRIVVPVALMSVKPNGTAVAV